jgi:integrin beta 3
MTGKDLAVVVRGIAPVVREYVTLGLSGLSARLDALEQKTISVGRDGRDGAQGEKGLDGQPGAPGERGAEGPAGPPGRDGAAGERGADGQPGIAGERGPEGPEGKPGRDGRDGLPGVPGLAGEKGMDGRHGNDGADGLGFDDLAVLHDGERAFTFRFTKGDRVKEFAFSMPVELYRGVYVEGKTYDRGDGVTWAGSEWHANETTNTKPGDGSKAWTLKVKRGRDGKDGRDAPQAPPVVSIGVRS